MTAKTWLWHNKFSLLLLAAATAVTLWAIHAFHRPGQIDVVTAQAMDMSAMQPPTGAMPVALARVTRSAAGGSVAYTGTLLAYNTQEIAPRVTGIVTSFSIYPGQTVHAGEVVARIDAQENDARAQAATADAQKALAGAQVASETALQARAALDASSAQIPIAQAALIGAKADAEALNDAISDARAGVASANANADYWTAEIAREKKLVDAGAASRQEYQSELAQAQSAQSAGDQARAKLSVAQAQSRSALAKVRQMVQELAAARQSQAVAEAGAQVARSQIAGEQSGVTAAQASAREAAVLAGYTAVTAPADGVVTDRPVAPGSLVQAGTVLARIAQIDRLRAQANVAVDDLAGIGVGSLVTIIFANGKTTMSRVTSVFPSADAETHTAVVEALLPNPGHRDLPGTFVTMRLTKPGGGDFLRVPEAAVLRGDGGTSVWVARQDTSGDADTRYRCEICGMTYSAADAKRSGYKDPMDGGKLDPVASQSSGSTGGQWTAHRVSVTVSGTDGDFTALAPAVAGGGGGSNADGLSEGDNVIILGQTGLTEGASVLPSPLTPNSGGTGSRSQLSGSPELGRGGRTAARYRCETCGMIYSAADAKRNGYKDPMDGGRLDPVN